MFTIHPYPETIYHIDESKRYRNSGYLFNYCPLCGKWLNENIYYESKYEDGIIPIDLKYDDIDFKLLYCLNCETPFKYSHIRYGYDKLNYYLQNPPLMQAYVISNFVYNNKTYEGYPCFSSLESFKHLIKTKQLHSITFKCTCSELGTNETCSKDILYPLPYYFDNKCDNYDISFTQGYKKIFFPNNCTGLKWINGVTCVPGKMTKRAIK